MKHKKKKHKDKNDKDCGIDEKVAEEVAKKVFSDVRAKTDERRILARKPDGEIVFEISMNKGLVILTLLTIFLFPAVVIAAIGSYIEKIHFSIIRELSDDEAGLLETVDGDHTLVGVQYETGDGDRTQLVKA